MGWLYISWALNIFQSRLEVHPVNILRRDGINLSFRREDDSIFLWSHMLMKTLIKPDEYLQVLQIPMRRNNKSTLPRFCICAVIIGCDRAQNRLRVLQAVGLLVWVCDPDTRDSIIALVRGNGVVFASVVQIPSR